MLVERRPPKLPGEPIVGVHVPRRGVALVGKLVEQQTAIHTVQVAARRDLVRKLHAVAHDENDMHGRPTRRHCPGVILAQRVTAGTVARADLEEVRAELEPCHEPRRGTRFPASPVESAVKGAVRAAAGELEGRSGAARIRGTVLDRNGGRRDVAVDSVLTGDSLLAVRSVRALRAGGANRALGTHLAGLAVLSVAAIRSVLRSAAQQQTDQSNRKTRSLYKGVCHFVLRGDARIAPACSGSAIRLAGSLVTCS